MVISRGLFFLARSGAVIQYCCNLVCILAAQVVLTRSEPAGSFMLLRVPCNRIPAGFSTNEFRSVPVHSSRNRQEIRRNSSVEKPAGIRLQGTCRNIKDPAGSGRFRQGSDRFLRSEWSTWVTNPKSLCHLKGPPTSGSTFFEFFENHIRR